MKNKILGGMFVGLTAVAGMLFFNSFVTHAQQNNGDIPGDFDPLYSGQDPQFNDDPDYHVPGREDPVFPGDEDPEYSGGGIGIKNPLKNNINSLPQLIAEILKFAVNILSVVGALYIMWTGFLFVKAQGNPKELDAAKKAFFNAIIGMALILGAWGLAQVIATTIQRVTGVDTGIGLNN